ncbi:diguanylate cyclase (GGDEF) domain protein [Cellvibrio japonicus Ueda107]|uniref:Diguanylate cyclase (GGDEF) domain protein n=1 Tax=Cellvibrio japonicus (strain Ueda107) TaxID=498211 RepID=B3PHC9_CELJU|nr:diguanylate cyclase (GGDEF) domain protein [Cellvibrio japonicus Ueda107]
MNNLFFRRAINYPTGPGCARPVPLPIHQRSRRHAMPVNLFSLALLWLWSHPLCADTLRLQLKWTHSFQFAGYYAALEQGYYRELGLDVEFLEASPNTPVADRVMAGEAEFGVGTSSLLLERHRGKPLVVLANIFQHSAQVLVARQQSPLQGVHDLAGKTLMLEDGADELVAYLTQEGLTPDKYRTITHSANHEDLLNGRVDAMSAYSSYELYHFRQAHQPLQIYTPRSAGIDFYGDNLFTSSKLIRRNPRLVDNFRDASLRGWQYAMANPEDIIALIMLRYTSQHSADFLRAEAEHMQALIRPDLIEIGYSNPGRWRHIADTYADLGLLPQGFSLDGFLYQQGLGDNRTWFYAALTTLLGALVIFAIALHVYRVNSKLHNLVRLMRRADVQQRNHNHVLALIAADEPLEDILLSLVEGVEHLKPEMKCSVLLFDRKQQKFSVAAAPSLPDFYNQAIAHLQAHDTAGSCGAAVATGKRVIVSNIQTHPNWEAYRQLAAQADLMSCWSEPILNRHGEALGTFAIYQHKVAEPTAEDIQLIEESAYLAEIAIERKQALEALRESEERHRMMAQHDNLTGLPNRALFADRLQQALSYAKRHHKSLAVMLLDLDDFKPVNDTYGHALGDELLKAVALRLQEAVRASDTVARIGGDEFVILLHQIDSPAQARIVSDKIGQLLAQEFWLGEQSIHIGCSIGIAYYPQDSSDARELTHIADQRMYEQKQLHHPS